jgi:hypothetical protein
MKLKALDLETWHSNNGRNQKCIKKILLRKPEGRRPLAR